MRYGKCALGFIMLLAVSLILVVSFLGHEHRALEEYARFWVECDYPSQGIRVIRTFRPDPNGHAPTQEDIFSGKVLFFAEDGEQLDAFGHGTLGMCVSRSGDAVEITGFDHLTGKVKVRYHAISADVGHAGCKDGEAASIGKESLGHAMVTSVSNGVTVRKLK